MDFHKIVKYWTLLQVLIARIFFSVIELDILCRDAPLEHIWLVQTILSVFGQIWRIWPYPKLCEIRIPLICWSSKWSQKVQEISAKTRKKSTKDTSNCQGQ